jgi:hypothetical protein
MSDSDVFLQPDGTEPTPHPSPSPVVSVAPASRHESTGPSPFTNLTKKMDRLHREAHAGMYVEGCVRCKNGV